MRVAAPSIVDTMGAMNGLTNADTLMVEMGVQMAIVAARHLPSRGERIAYLTRQQFSGAHRSGVVVIGADTAEYVVDKIEALEQAIMNVVKGSTIRARWFQATDACLAGVQPKVGARERDVTGIVRHVRGDHPTAPTSIRIYIDAPGADVTPPGCTCGPHVEVDPRHVVSVEGAEK